MQWLYDLISNHKLPIALCLLGTVLILGGLLLPQQPQKRPFTKESFPKESLVEPKVYKVDVSGAVRNPGVYALSGDARIEDAIKMAGGVSETVNTAYFAKAINLSAKISDGMKVYLPFREESGLAAVGEVAGVQATTINVNSASLQELESLPSIGPVSAQKIVTNRPYGSKQELVTKKVVSQKTFDKILSLIDI